MESDIVARLRDIEGGYSFRAICREAADEIERLRAELKESNDRIAAASILLYDWDGYYDAIKKKGNTVELANLVEDVYKELQGKYWREKDENGK
jgi:hypothetical protein